MSDDEVAAVAGSLRPEPAAAAAPRLPPGFEVDQDGPVPTVAFKFTDQAWESEAEKFRLTVTAVPDVSLDAVAWGHPNARAVEVRGVAGLFNEATDRESSLLTWVERRDTVVSLLGYDMGLARLRDIASNLRPVDEAAWHNLAATLVVASLPKGFHARHRCRPRRPGTRAFDHQHRRTATRLLRARARSKHLTVPQALTLPR